MAEEKYGRRYGGGEKAPGGETSEKPAEHQEDPVMDRHLTERTEMHGRHETEMKQVHARHLEEHKQINERHTQEISAKEMEGGTEKPKVKDDTKSPDA